MERNNINSTKENPVKSFGKNQKEIYNEYKHLFSESHKELYPVEIDEKERYLIEKEDRQIMALEKSCDILGTVLKVEAVITLIVVTFAVIFNGFPYDTKSQTQYKEVSISTEVDDKTKI